jgi:hypothetical protein
MLEQSVFLTYSCPSPIARDRVNLGSLFDSVVWREVYEEELRLLSSAAELPVSSFCGRRWLVALPTLVALMILASGVVPWRAAAEPATGETPHRVARFYLRAPHGYKVTVVAAVEGAESPVRIVAEGHRGGAEYQTLGTVTSNTIHASFGPLGRVSLRFLPSGRVLHSMAEGGGCSLRAKAHIGTFVGTFRFRGEGGYTALTIHRIRGGIGSPAAPINENEQGKLGCPDANRTYVMPPDEVERHFSEGLGGETTPGRGVVAVAVAQDEATAFITWGFSLRHPEEEGAIPDFCIFMALKEETRGLVSISREVFQGGPVSQCQLDESIGTLSVTPEAPFTGTAAFQRGSDGSTSWLGSLAVPMLGRGIVPLAGPEFESELVKK